MFYFTLSRVFIDIHDQERVEQVRVTGKMTLLELELRCAERMLSIKTLILSLLQLFLIQIEGLTLKFLQAQE